MSYHSCHRTGTLGKDLRKYLKEDEIRELQVVRVTAKVAKKRGVVRDGDRVTVFTTSGIVWFRRKAS